MKLTPETYNLLSELVEETLNSLDHSEANEPVRKGLKRALEELDSISTY